MAPVLPEIIEAMTRDEFRDSVFYMPSDNFLGMIHLNLEDKNTNYIKTSVFS